ncbi:phosphonoacetaldehyde hydrolase [Scopulibacillus darangshiensis]|uniref:Phosphonoacetaldehyde hydrolase n=1 Tax=Scopulibacillus darangshiensis TaxID=442528 RepID=A0A4R2P943_9BACL|nr:phosphonoacetaldehyde hydrolase [Scopulibacillus darangshiensis]TCP31550.1 phosphonoacetaldehyde hydrolase [Scopulibacillus darangshiensis]
MGDSNRQVKAVIFDWAGTIVDYGCMAPVVAFKEVFHQKGIDITVEEARLPMGLEKMDHIRTILKMDRVHRLWQKVYKQAPNEDDVHELYSIFEPTLVDVLPRHSTPIPGVREIFTDLRKKDIKIGSTTGYSRKMINLVADQFKKHGLAIDSVLASDDVTAGRPEPWMCLQNAINLQVYPMAQMVKVGDTLTDIQEGIEAGMWTVGVVKGGNEFGQSERQIKEAAPIELEAQIKAATNRFYEAGADFVIDDISGLTDVIATINRGLKSEVQAI